MKSSICFAACLCSLLMLTACATPHTMTLKNGSIIEMADEPKFNRNTGFYEYESLDGKKVQVNKDEVLDVKEM